jgi:hypothetical protein
MTLDYQLHSSAVGLYRPLQRAGKRENLRISPAV